MKNRIRFGILGTGFIAGKFAEASAALKDEMELRAVASRTLDKADAFAQDRQIPYAYGSYEALAAAEDIDAVYIATPHNFHLENIRMCAKHGKHILCEKPVCISLKEAEQLREISQEYGVFIMEAYWSAFVPAYDKLKELLASGAIGRYRFLRSEIGFSHSGDRGFRKVNPNLAGGSLLDVGVYNIMIAGELFGFDLNIVDVCAGMCDLGVDVYDSFVFEHQNGLKSYHMATVKGKLDNKLIVYGETGCLTLHNFLGSQKVTLDANGEPPISFEYPFESNGYEYEIRHVCRCIQSGKLESDVIPLRHSEAILGICDKIREQIGLKYSFE